MEQSQIAVSHGCHESFDFAGDSAAVAGFPTMPA
jgi:hypothetical protein